MFDGVPADQFHQFIATASRTSLPIPLSFPLHGSSPMTAAPPPPPPPSSFPSFDHYPTHQTLQHAVVHHHHQQHSIHQLQQHHQLAAKDEKNEEERCLATNLMLDRDHRSVTDPWSNDEVLTLLRIRSSMDSWFPDFTWEHVSRKLAEVGFKRSGEKCKEKFEEESRNFNSFAYNKNYRFFTSELDELYHQAGDQVLTQEKNQNIEKQNEPEKEDQEQADHNMEEVTANPSLENEEVKKPDDQRGKKRKRKNTFEMLKGVCEAIINKIMSQQEELHNKFMNDLLKRDEEMIAREEAWKNQEMDRLNKAIEIRAKEQAIANERQTILINLLKKFIAGSYSHDKNLAKEVEDFLKLANKNTNGPSDQTLSHDIQNPNSQLQLIQLQPTNVVNETSSSTLSLTTQNPNSSNMQNNPSLNTPSSSYKGTDKREDSGKRWPRDEVLALINLKCSLIDINNGDDSNKEVSATKGPLWERISQGMQQLGYRRSSKRCKEKWENINKYFRKTKDNNKKRSLDSRTCPYFHQLNSLYNQGILVAPTDVIPENRSANPNTISENISMAASPHDEDISQLPSA